MAKCPKCGTDRLKLVADRKILERILEILYWDSDDDCWDPNKEWNADLLDDIADQISQSHLYKRYLGARPDRALPRVRKTYKEVI